MGDNHNHIAIGPTQILARIVAIKALSLIWAILILDTCHTFNIPRIPHICCPCRIHLEGHGCLLPLFDKCISHITNRVQGGAPFYRQAISYGCKGHPFKCTELIFLSPHKSNIFELVIWWIFLCKRCIEPDTFTIYFLAFGFPLLISLWLQILSANTHLLHYKHKGCTFVNLLLPPVWHDNFMAAMKQINLEYFFGGKTCNRH